MTSEEDAFREYAEKVFPYRKDKMWDNVDDWIKYGDLFLNLRFEGKPLNEKDIQRPSNR